MKIVATGLSSALGQALLARLSSEVQVAAIGRTPVSHPRIYRFEKINLAEANASEVEAIFSGERFDCLIHMAAKVPRTPVDDDFQELFSTNVLGTFNLVSGLAHRCKRVIHISTSEIFEKTRSEEKVTSGSAPRPTSNYSHSKFMAETVIEKLCTPNMIESLHLRLTNLYGYKDEISRAIPNFIKQAKSQPEITVHGANQLRDYLHVEDAAMAINLALNNLGVAGVLPIGTGRSISILQLAQGAVSTVGADARLLPVYADAPTHLIVDESEALHGLGFKAKRTFPDGLESMLDDI